MGSTPNWAASLPPVQTALNSEQPRGHHQGFRDGAGGALGSGDSRKPDVRAAPHTWEQGVAL